MGMFASLTDDWRFAGLTAVLTDQEIVTSAMAILPDIRKKVELRRILRRGRRYRKNRRRKARQKDTKKAGWISPTQRAKVEFRLTLINRYLKLYPITYFAVEDVKFNLCLDFTNPSTSFVKSRRKSLQEALG